MEKEILQGLRTGLPPYVQQVIEYFNIETIHVTAEDYQSIIFILLVIALLQTMSLNCIFIYSCFCSRKNKQVNPSSNKTKNNSTSGGVKNNYSPVNINNLGSVTPPKDRNSLTNITNTSTNYFSSLNNTKKDFSDEETDIKEVVDQMNEDFRENSFTMRLREEEQRKLKHEKNVQKKISKKTKKTGNASDDDDAGEWKTVKQGKTTQIKKKQI